MNKVVTVKLPDIGEGVVEGEVIEWLKQVNDLVQQDEPVVIVMTDKATVELPSPAPGKLVKQYCRVGEMAVKDKPLYDIQVSEEAIIAPPTPLPKVEVEKAAIAPSKKEAITPERTVSQGQKALATPKTRQLAKEMGLDINLIQGTGREGQVTLEDLKMTHEASIKTEKVPSPILHLPGDEEKPLVGIPALMAKKMAESKAKIPHFSYFEQAEATRLVQLRQKYNEEAIKQGHHVTYMPFLIKALSLTLKQYPTVNSSLDTVQTCLIIHRSHNVGIAINTSLGLIVPVIKDVQDMSLKEIVYAYEDLKNRALTGHLKSQDMKDSTITISNFGVLGGGGLWATPIINYPEVAILAVARIQKQPIVKNDNVVIRDVLNLSWSFDHRIIDGDLAATFSHHFATFIQNPAPLL
jgi:pyruvate dehydrogenase E2 component (dihydrolipoamide acetyltransferase)